MAWNVLVIVLRFCDFGLQVSLAVMRMNAVRKCMPRAVQAGTNKKLAIYVCVCVCVSDDDSRKFYYCAYR